MRLAVSLVFVYVMYKPAVSVKYAPDWTSLDKRKLPEWYDRAKIGIMVHWGIYSVPAYGPPSAPNAEWFGYHWTRGNTEVLEFMGKTFPRVTKYEDFVDMFTAEKFDPTEWANLFRKAGAKYVVLTSKHHDGFALFNSNYSGRWNSVEMGPHRDIVAELRRAVVHQGLHFGVYYYLAEWRHLLYLQDQRSAIGANDFVDEKIWPEARQLIKEYSPSIFWADGDLTNTRQYWNATNFIAWLYNSSPVKDEIVVNDRWGVVRTRAGDVLLGRAKTRPRHGDFHTRYDRYNPRKLQFHKWENVFSLDKRSWGYRTNMGKELMSIKEVIENVVSTVSCGGNVLINVGATKEGKIAPEFVEVLQKFGEWMEVNGPAIYDSSPWRTQSEDDRSVWYTCTTDKYDGSHPIAVPWQPDTTATYAIILKWPFSGLLRLRAITPLFRGRDHYVEILGRQDRYLMWAIKDEDVVIQLPPKKVMPSRYAWTLKFTIKR